MDEVEELVDRGGGGEVPNVDGTASGSVGGAKSNLEGSGRILCLYCDWGVRSYNDGVGRPVERHLTWKLFIWLLYGNPPMVPKTFIPGRPIPNML